jgi:hypothetical protein
MRVFMFDPWDVRPKADKGDADPNNILHRVGAALSAWEMLEMSLAELFDALVASGNRAAHGAYTAVIASVSRGEMLRAAIDRALRFDTTFQAGAGEFAERVGKFAARRNEIAHGCALNLGEYGYYFGPTTLLRRKWTKEGLAKYQYVAADIEHYAKCFMALKIESDNLTEAVKGAIAATKSAPDIHGEGSSGSA